MSDPRDLAFSPGAVLAGKYRIERVLGQGGMGLVLAAHHIQLEHRVALKVMLPHASLSGEAVARFLREARAAARISSEHVARVYDVGALETGEPFIAMEYLDGSDLSELLLQRGSFPTDEAVQYLLQVCEALAEAHAAGIVHRDLKPANLFLTRRRDGRTLVKVLDFGISKVVDGSGPSGGPATKTSALMGTPLYMSPEQMASSKHVDARADVWALGVVLYEMLAGRAPFTGETLPQVCAMVMSRAPTPLLELVPTLPSALGAVVERCLEKDAAARFQTVAELARALQPLVMPDARQSVERILSIEATLPSASSTLADPPLFAKPQGTYAPVSDTQAPHRTNRSRLPLAVGLGLLALAGAALWLQSAPTPIALAPSVSAAIPDVAAVSLPPPAAALVASPPQASSELETQPLPSSSAALPPLAASLQLKRARPAATGSAKSVAVVSPALASAAPSPSPPPAHSVSPAQPPSESPPPTRSRL